MGNQQLRALVIEDDANLAEGIRDLLTFEGYKAAIALDGLQGLNSAKQTPPDIIVLDIMMDEMDGYEFLEEKGQVQAIKHIPVVVLSALRDHTSIKKAFDLGAVEYIKKPFHVRDFLGLLHNHLV